MSKQRQPQWSTGMAIESVHKFTFLQVMMSKPYCKETEAKTLVDSLLNAGSNAENDQLYEEFLAKINEELHMNHLELQLRSVKPPGEDESYIGLVNKDPDAPATHGTQYRPVEREYIRAVLQRLASSPDADEDGVAVVLSSTLLNLEGINKDVQGQPLSKNQKQELLPKLVEEGWLKALGAGRYQLGARAFLELGRYMLESYDMPESTREAWLDRIG